MRSSKNHAEKDIKHKSAVPKSQPVAGEDKPKDPPGVNMPPETEMSPPQLG